MNQLFPGLPIPKTIKTYDFYQNIKGDIKSNIENLIKYVFTLNDILIYKWLIAYYPQEYWDFFQGKRYSIRDKAPGNTYLITQLLSLYLTHYDLITYYKKQQCFIDSIKYWISMIPCNDIVLSCKMKYGIQHFS